MLRLIPAPLHRSLYRLAHALRRNWWRVRRPRLHGCRVVAVDAQGRVLLIRHSYGSGNWLPPGGGIARGENALGAAIREFREETGCELEGAFRLAVIEEELHGASNRVDIVAGRVRGEPRPDEREVVEASFFHPDDLPERMPARLRGQLPGWVRSVGG